MMPLRLSTHRILARPLFVMFALAVGACSSTKAPQSSLTLPVSVTVSPLTTSVAVGGVAISFSATVANAANSAVTWQVNGVDGGSPSTGTISASGQYVSPAVLPASPDVTVTAVSVEDPSQSDSAAVTLTSAAGPISVSVSPLTAAVAAGTGSVTFVATVANSTNQSVTWQVAGVPGGNATVGTISSAGVFTAPATPPAQPTVTVTAVSAADATKSGSASVTITAIAPPTIGGSPATTALVGQLYDFKPTASDPNGRALTFSVIGKPAWATFNSATGELTGTPGAADVGSSNITIVVSNGGAQASLAFTLAVTQSGSGSATVSWVIPTTRTDGSALTNLAGFKVYYGMQQQALSTVVTVSNPTVSTAVVNSLTSGTWYFAVTAVDANGLESAYSNIASKTI